MPLQPTDINWYRSETSAEAVLAGHQNNVTKNYGGSITVDELSGDIGSIFRNVYGTDLASLSAIDNWYDYAKVWVKNDHPSVLGEETTFPLVNVGLFVVPDGTSNLDTFSVGIGLSGRYYKNQTDPTIITNCGQDYDEDIDSLTPEDSPYPRITGSGEDINDVGDYNFDYDLIEGHKSTYGVSTFNVRIQPLPDAQSVGTDEKYIKVIGQNGWDIVIGFIDLEGFDDTPDTYRYAIVDRNFGVTTERQEFTRILCATIHTKSWVETNPSPPPATLTYDVATSIGTRDGALTYITLDSGDGDLIFDIGETDWTTVGKMYVNDNTEASVGVVGQCFATCFFPELAIDSVENSLRLPTITTAPGYGSIPHAVIINEFNDVELTVDMLDVSYQALWIRRNISKTAVSQPGITNLFYVFGDAS